MKLNKSENKDISRRTLLTGSSATVLSSIAGCLESVSLDLGEYEPLNADQSYSTDEIPKHLVSRESRKIIENSENITPSELSEDSEYILTNLNDPEVTRMDGEKPTDFQSFVNNIAGNRDPMTHSREVSLLDSTLSFEGKIGINIYIYGTIPKESSNLTHIKSETKYVQPRSIASLSIHGNYKPIIIEYSVPDEFRNEFHRIHVTIENRETTNETEYPVVDIRSNSARIRSDSYIDIDDEPAWDSDEVREITGKYPIKFTNTEIQSKENLYNMPERETQSIFNKPDGVFNEFTHTYPYEHYELAKEINQNFSPRDNPEVKFSRDISDLDYDWYNRDTYDVLDHPLYTKLANEADQIIEQSSMNNSHYARIRFAADYVKFVDYTATGGQIRGLEYAHLPEEYVVDNDANCVGHSYNLMWLLYHLGYKTSLVSFKPDYSTGTIHAGTIVQLPEEIIRSEFPSQTVSGLFQKNNTDYPLITEDYVIDSWVKHSDVSSESDIRTDYNSFDFSKPWVYIEATDPETVGKAYEISNSAGDLVYGDSYIGIDRPIIKPENSHFE